MHPLSLKWKMDWAFNSLSHFICKISLVTLLFTWSAGTYQEMLHFAREDGTVQGSVFNSPWGWKRSLLHDTSEKHSQIPGTTTAMVNYQFGSLSFFSLDAKFILI